MYMCTLRADSSFELNSNVYQALLNPEKAGDFTGEEEGGGGYCDLNLNILTKSPVCVCVGGGGGRGGTGIRTWNILTKSPVYLPLGQAISSYVLHGS